MRLVRESLLSFFVVAVAVPLYLLAAVAAFFSFYSVPLHRDKPTGKASVCASAVAVKDAVE